MTNLILYVTFISLLAIQHSMSATTGVCKAQTTCQQCAYQNTGAETDRCRWCPLTRRCHDYGSNDNPCPPELDIGEQSDCPAVSSFAYNSTAAFHHVLLSAVAYSEHPDKCMQKIREIEPRFDYEIFDDNFIAERCDDFFFDYKVCVAMIMISHANKEIVITYRGTSQNVQLLDEALVALIKKQRFGLGNVHAYFLNGFKKLQRCAIERLLTMIEMHKDYSVTVSGHSLGGAMASIMSMHVREKRMVFQDRVKLYTYGQPRTGDKTYAVEHDKLVPNSWRIVHQRDIVPHVPPCWPKCDRGGATTSYHHGMEIFYDSDSMEDHSDYVQCQANHDRACSRKYTQFFSREFFKPWKWYNGYLDHVNYFDIPVGSYCESLLGYSRRRRRSIGEALHDQLPSNNCTTLYRLNDTNTWVSRIQVSPTQPTTSVTNSASYQAQPLLCIGLLPAFISYGAKQIF